MGSYQRGPSDMHDWAFVGKQHCNQTCLPASVHVSPSSGFSLIMVRFVSKLIRTRASKGICMERTADPSDILSDSMHPYPRKVIHKHSLSVPHAKAGSGMPYCAIKEFAQLRKQQPHSSKRFAYSVPLCTDTATMQETLTSMSGCLDNLNSQARRQSDESILRGSAGCLL